MRRALALTALLLLPRLAVAVPPGSPQSVAALRLCRSLDEVPAAERDAALARGLAMAEAAAAADANDARAHFALVCYLGRRAAQAGFGLGQLVTLRRLRSEVERTLALAPGDADALLAKGALLLRLPRLLGGDAAEAEALLGRALAADPDNVRARCYVAEAQRARGVVVEPLPGC
jgi:hypothetical protein